MTRGESEHWRPLQPAKAQVGKVVTPMPYLIQKDTPEERCRAARYIASAAKDKEDCAYLLDMLGLTVEDGICNGDNR